MAAPTTPMPQELADKVARLLAPRIKARRERMAREAEDTDAREAS